MSLTQSQQFAALSDHFAERRDAIMQAWRKADRADPEQTTGRSLALGQFQDHVPEMLDAFELRLRSRSGETDARAADADKKIEGIKHGLHRWQQGFRLQAGQETRKIAPFDASALLTELCAAHQPMAHEHHLFLEGQGLDRLMVEGDAEKTRRLAKNLLGNALKYTPHGGVEVTWGEEKETWWLMVKDTGPGMLSVPGTPLVTGLQEATASAKDSDDKSDDNQGEASQVLSAPERASTPSIPSLHQPGEGIGLSIVKRLCELLGASIEIATSAETGTTFRVVFPLRYQQAPKAEPSPA